MLIDVPLDRLVPHPDNANAMPEPMLAKLTDHMRRTGRYPPLIIRPAPGSTPASGCAAEQAYQLLDGHHRVEAARRLGWASIRCVVWDVDDDEATLLLATLNRLQGSDDPARRAALVARLAASVSRPKLARLLPERADQIRRLLELHAHRAGPRLTPPRPLGEMPVAVHFFLRPAQRVRLEAALGRIGGPRDAALMALVDRAEAAGADPADPTEPCTHHPEH